MKRKVFSAIIIAMFLAGNTLTAQPYEQSKNKFVTLGFSGNSIGDEFLPGFIAGFGYYTSPKSLLTFEFSSGGKNGIKLGEYSYYVQNKDGSNRKEYNDGVVHLHHSYLLPMISWSYIGSLSEKVQWRIGPSVGFLSITTGDSFWPTSKDGTSIDDIPYSDKQSGGAGMFGANVGLTWNFHKRWFIDFGYRLSANTGVHNDEVYIKYTRETIPERDFGKIGNQINVNVGFRF